MQDTILTHYKKSIFWQRIIAASVAFSLLLGVFSFLYFFIDSYEYRQLLEFRHTRQVFTGLILSGTCLVGLGLTIYLNWSLFKAASCLKKYSLSKELADLELAIKYQTLFWKLLTLSPFIAFGLLVLMFMLIALASNIIQGGTIFEPEPIQVG